MGQKRGVRADGAPKKRKHKQISSTSFTCPVDKCSKSFAKKSLYNRHLREVHHDATLSTNQQKFTTNLNKKRQSRKLYASKLTKFMESFNIAVTPEMMEAATTWENTQAEPLDGDDCEKEYLCSDIVPTTLDRNQITNNRVNFWNHFFNTTQADWDEMARMQMLPHPTLSTLHYLI